ncbi:MAG: choice-of-anchor I family protein [Saprospiraceae bacterium]
MVKSSFLLIIFTIITTTLAAQELQIEEIGRYTDGRPETLEIVTYDPVTAQLFVTNSISQTIDILNITHPEEPVLVTQVDISPYGNIANSVVHLKNGYFAAAIEDNVKQNAGKVVFFESNGKYANQVKVGALPDMITVTPDGKKVLVANEGEPNAAYTNDPEGSISIIDIRAGIPKLTQKNVKTLDFKNAPTTIKGSIRTPNASTAQDLEPEYIAVNANSTLAAVTCQETNVIVYVDLVADKIVQYAGLGFKDYSLPANRVDFSDKDGGIRLKNWNVKGVYQPDAIAAYTASGKTYFVTANEGDSRDYDGYSSETRLKNLNLDKDAFPNGDQLKENAQLGRLKTFTPDVIGDIDNDGDVDEIYAYGGRSFSIWDDKGQLVWDSKGDFEDFFAKNFPDFFNYGNTSDKIDYRSDDKGSEPEAITVGQINGRTYAFIGLERQSGIIIYNITNPKFPYFVDYLHSFEESIKGAIDVAPEGILFIPANKSHTKTNLLVVANEISGTATIYEIK